jgi:hypothetical protein
VEELANGRDPKTLARDILGDITTFRGRSEIGPANNEPWLTWGNDSHVLSNSVAFDSFVDGADLEDAYIKGRTRRWMFSSASSSRPAYAWHSCSTRISNSQRERDCLALRSITGTGRAKSFSARLGLCAVDYARTGPAAPPI